MRQVFLFVLFSILFTFLFLLDSKYKAIPKIKDKIKVQIIYHNKNYDLSLEPYTSLDEALKQIYLKDDVLESAINRNMILSHRDVINIPIRSEESCISINYANLDELTKVNGLGPKTAQSIIDYRNEFGLFQKLEDLLEVKGIGEKKLEKMRDSLCL